ncbi:MAG: LpqB family beta-propeller domain-containing protein [Actinobacteria bacterium]|nr:LpqB family beta-propeller domain-containing protein [Actinomycetota bacterium]
MRDEEPGNFDIWVMNADGSGKVKLKSHGDYPEWSPDGRQIAFWTAQANGDGFIYVMNADGSGAKPVAGGISIRELNLDPGGDLGWTPDGKILFMRTTDKSADVFAVNQDGSGLTQLTKGAELGRFSLSPDGTRIALHDQALRLYVAPVQGTGKPVTLLEQTNSYLFDVWARASWSPDGKAVAFSTDSIVMMAGYPLYVINADGSGFSRVPEITWAFDPAWRPE